MSNYMSEEEKILVLHTAITILCEQLAEYMRDAGRPANAEDIAKGAICRRFK